MSARPILIIASKNEIIANSLENYVKLFLGDHLPHRLHKPLTLTCREDLHGILDDLPQQEIFNTVCVVDLTEDEVGLKWKLSEDNNFFRPVELILRYPEVYWIFVMRKLPEDCEISFVKNDILVNMIFNNSFPGIEECHFVELTDMKKLVKLLYRHANGFRTCFDPTGFRRVAGDFEYTEYDFTYKEINNNPTPRKGVVLDEETNFAFLNGYILYRHGFEVHIVQSKEEAEEISKSQIAESFNISLEDVALQFEACAQCNDRNLCRDRYLGLSFRSYKYPFIKHVKKRIYITFLSDNSYGFQCTIQKPHSGVFDENLIKHLDTFLRAKLYDVKPIKQKSHSAPFLNLSIAESLLGRARRYSTNDTVAAVHVSLLALEAKEILGGMTPFLSLEAIKIQHQTEVIAECSFVGTEEMSVERRFEDIVFEIDKIDEILKKEYKMSSDGSRERGLKGEQRYNALVEIADDLRQVYRNYEQFDEEEKALIKVREYRWKLKATKQRAISQKNSSKQDNARNRKGWWAFAMLGLISIIKNWKWLDEDGELHERVVEFSPVKWVSLMIELYFNLLVKSFKNILFFAIYWVMLFSLLYLPFSSLILKGIHSIIPIRALFTVSILNSLSTFIALQPIVNINVDYGWPEYYIFWSITIIEMIIGFLHFGIFIAYLYQKIARK